MKKSLLMIIYYAICISVHSQNCDLSITKNRRTQVRNPIAPFSFVIQMDMKRGRTYHGTAFLIHPRVLLTAGHNLRKRPQFIFTRVKHLNLRFGATDINTDICDTTFETVQNENIYTLESFNNHYNILTDYGIVILPDDRAYKKVGGFFKIAVFDSLNFSKRFIHIAGYPSDKDFSTLWQDSTQNYFLKNGYMFYDFSTEEGVSGGPVWYQEDSVQKVFGIHTNGFLKGETCNKATLITKDVYDDIVSFCLSKGIDIR